MSDDPVEQEKAAERSLSFRAVFEAELGYVCRVLLRFGVHRKDLDDLAQEVFLVVYRRRLDYDPGRPLRPWLCGIAYRVASDWRRRAVHREVLGDDALAHASEGARDGPSQAVEERNLMAHQLVQRALSTLPFERRVVVVLCDLEGYSAPEAAELLGIPAGTIYSRLHEARRTFVASVRALEGAT